MFTFYEEYETPQTKRAAQRGANRSKVTGLATGYLFTTKQYNPNGLMEAVASIYAQGIEPKAIGLTCTEVSRDYLHQRCRRIGRESLPKDWRDAFDRYLTTD